MANQDIFVYEPKRPAQAAIIWLHGLGADASDFVGLMEQLRLPIDHTVRFIFPNAPFKNITVNQGMRMRAWYDIYDINILRKEDDQGVQDSEKILLNIIAQQEQQGIASNKIILGGFSQGGAMSLYTGLRCRQTLGGIVALSAYMPIADSFDSGRHPQNKHTPIFMAHGMFDPVVPYGVGQAACLRLQQEGYRVDWNAYPMVHTVSIDEIYALAVFINRCLGDA